MQWSKDVGNHNYCWGYFFSIYFFFTDIHDSHDNKEEVMSTTALYHYHLLHRHLNIMHLASILTQTRNFFSECKLLTTTLCGKNYRFLQKLEILRIDKWWKSFFSYHIKTQFTLKIKFYEPNSHNKLSNLKDMLGHLYKRLK